MKRLACFAALIILAAPAFADDGVLFVKNIPKTPELESDHAKLELLKLYVPAQATDGTLLRDTEELGIVYEFKDDLYPSFTREYAKPLISFYTDGHVVSVEIHPDLLESARLRLEAHNAFNITLEQGDGVAGRASGAPYDVIAMTGSVPILNEQLERQLSIGGRMFVVVGEI